MSKPVMTSTFCGFGDMLVDRMISQRVYIKGEKNEDDKNWARSHLADNGVTVLDFGDPWAVKIGEDWASTEEGIAYQISQQLMDWS
jgi:hypothetical protein